MKIYVVTDGEYSDYCIEKIFSNKPAAEEYKKWRNIRNQIEEYEVYDKAFEECEGEKVMFIRVQGTVYPEAVVDIRYDVRPDVVDNARQKSDRGVMSAYKTDTPAFTFVVYNWHYIPADNWDEEKYKAKFTKALYDQAAFAKNLLAEGASIHDVEIALRGMEE